MSDIKSSAVIKYSATKAPARYNELATNTNLNRPPDDWLQGRFGTKEPWAPGQAGSRHKQFSSFLMANTFIDHVGKVDVITDGENVKKLLKMNYSSAPVSMMIHRIGRTLLIDSLDVYRNVLYTQQHDWQWLKKFITSNVFTTDNESSLALMPVKALSRQELEANLMLSKFLYHSIENLKETEDSDDCTTSDSSNLNSNLPDPLVSEGEEFVNSSSFERNVLWNFEDIRMLIGTDMPIFGAGKHPCVTLRLRDMKKPISVLTGIDYWLDQLMSTVPEVVMCYHLNGIVQRYEILQTEDLPNLPDSSFSPELIRDVAQNILSFLKSNATKEGHTYWLFKDKDDDIVKLYDLTSVCREYMEETDANPFTLPVAVLLYRVARNLFQRSVQSRRKASNTIYRLLTHSLELLDPIKFPQVVGSAHYLLANLYLTCTSKVVDSTNGATNANVSCDKKDNNEKVLTTDGATAAADEFDDSFDYNDWYFEDPSNRIRTLEGASSNDGVSCISLDLLAHSSPDVAASERTNGGPAWLANQSKQQQQKFIPNCSNMEDCWQTALEHIFKGLESVELFEHASDITSVDTNSKRNSKSNGENVGPQLSNGLPIPLHYESLKKLGNESQVLPLAVRFPNATGWRLNLISLLLIKATKSYELLSDCAFKLQNFGKALRYIKLSFLCYESAMKLIQSSTVPDPTLQQCKRLAENLLPALFVLCGDIHYVLSHQKTQHMDRHVRDYNANMYRDNRITAQAKKIISDAEQEFAWCSEMSSSIEHSLQMSQRCYEHAMSLVRNSAIVQLDSTAADSQQQSCNKISKTSSVSHAAGSAADPSDEPDLGFIVDAVFISKRLGNVKNDFGVYYMNLSQTILLKEKDGEEANMKRVENCWHMSYKYFQEGIQIFNKINDKDNEALLNSNACRLMRLCANTYAETSKEFKKEEEHYYNAAIEMYQRALECVNPKSNQSRVWEAVAWELSSVYFVYAVQLQNRPPLSSRSIEEIEKETADLMQKSLRLVEALNSIDSSKHAVYLYRISTIHFKLASLYHCSYRNKEQTNDRRAKQLRSLTELHYKKASEGFKESVIEYPTDYIRVQLERALLVECSIDSVAGQNSKLKLYEEALQLILSCRSAFISLCRKFSTEISWDRKKNNISNNDILDGSENLSATSPGEEMLNGNTSECINEKDIVTTTTGKVANNAKDKEEAAEEGFINECKDLCEVTVRRLQALTKAALFLVGRKDAKFNVWKESYATTLARKPTEISALPSFVLNMLEKLHSLKK